MERGIVMAGYAGGAGAGKLAKERFDELTKRFPVYFTEEAVNFSKDSYDEEVMDFIKGKEAYYKAEDPVSVSDGGVFAALWELGERYRTGFAVTLKKIPVKQQTIEICNYFDIDPYRLYAKGCVLVLSEYAERLAEDLNAAAIPAAVIGREHEARKRVVYYDDEERFLEPRRGDSISEVG